MQPPRDAWDFEDLIEGWFWYALGVVTSEVIIILGLLLGLLVWVRYG